MHLNNRFIIELKSIDAQNLKLKVKEAALMFVLAVFKSYVDHTQWDLHVGKKLCKLF